MRKTTNKVQAPPEGARSDFYKPLLNNDLKAAIYPGINPYQSGEKGGTPRLSSKGLPLSTCYR
jgi:hypothetical protein